MTNEPTTGSDGSGSQSAGDVLHGRSGQVPSRRPSIAAALLLVVVTAAFAASRLWIAGVPSEREYDEGVYLCSARAVAAGHALFSDVFSSQPPAIVETLALALKAFGDNLFVARTFVLAFALLALIAVADVARRLGGPWAAPVAAGALGLSVNFTDLAHVVVAETPALGLSLAAMAACLASRERGWNLALLAASGALFGLAALFKLIVLPLAAPIGLLLLLAPRDGGQSGTGGRQPQPIFSSDDGWRFDRRITSVIARCATVAVAALVVLALPVLVYDAADIYDQVIAFHLSKHETYELNPSANLNRGLLHIRTDAAIVGVAAIGVVGMAFRARLLPALWLLVWTLSVVLVLAVQTPLFWRHYVLLALPVAIAAGAGFGRLFGSHRRAGALALAVIGVWTAVAVSRHRGMFPHGSDGAKVDASVVSLVRSAESIRSLSLQEDLVGSDDQMTVFVSGRHSPPGLCDTSWARVTSKSLDLEEAARASLPARVIMLRAGSRLSGLPGYVAWLKRNYEQQPAKVTGLGTHRTIWIRKPGATLDARNPPADPATVSSVSPVDVRGGPADPKRGANRLKAPTDAAPAR